MNVTPDINITSITEATMNIKRDERGFKDPVCAMELSRTTAVEEYTYPGTVAMFAGALANIIFAAGLACQDLGGRGALRWSSCAVPHNYFISRQTPDKRACSNVGDATRVVHARRCPLRAERGTPGTESGVCKDGPLVAVPRRLGSHVFSLYS